MTTITTRAGKGSPLTNNEMDTNLTNLNTAKIETAMIVAAISKTTPADADLLPLVDSAASNTLKKLTWANLKAAITGSFATLTGVETLTNKTLTSPVINGTGLHFTDLSVQNTAATGFGFKNRIINGSMAIDQRNAGASVTVLTTTGYTIDRWTTAVDASSKISVQQVSDAPEGFTTSLKATSLSAYTPLSNQEFRIGQFVEGFNFADFGFGSSSAKTATLSFWVKSSLTGTFGVYVANSDNSRTFVSTYTINVANTWEQKTVTINGDTSGTWLTNNGRGIQINFALSAGSNYFTSTTNSWTSTSTVRTTSSQTQLVSTNAATWQVTGVQLEKGSTATSFDYRPYPTELALCQRYYWKYNNTSGSEVGLCTSAAFQAGNIYGVLKLPVTMRSIPTGNKSSNAAITVYANGSGMQTSSISFPASSSDEAEINVAAAGVAQGSGNWMRLLNNSWLDFSSEL